LFWLITSKNATGCPIACLGQLRQTQTAAEGGNTAVTDQFRDSHGWVWQSNNKYVVSGSPTASLASVAETAVNDRTVSAFDGTGRVITAQADNGTTLTKTLQTVYGGNQVTTMTLDPAGNVVGTPTAAVTNVLGQQTQQIQYAGTPTVTGSVVSGGSPPVTSASYDAAGNKASVADPAGNTWTYGYDMLGRKIKAVDPDTGTTVTGYDAAGNVTYTTDGAGISDNYVYDALNRKTAEFTGSVTPGSGTQVATWVWDTLKKGLLSSETSVSNGVTYKTGNLGYNSIGVASGTFVQVPSGQPLAGTYRTQYSYSTTGQMLGDNPAAGGGLPADSLTYTYDTFGNPTSESGTDVYASGAVWTPYGEISQIQLGSGPSAAALTYSYDPQTRAVTAVNLSDQQPSPQADNIAYNYNAARQVTQIADTQGPCGSPVQDQCFGYDSLSRLSQAWTSSNACATNPATGGSATVQSPQPYWQSWTFDQLGDILSRTDHAPAGSSSGDTTTTYTYGTSPVHAVTSTSVSKGSTSYGYDGGDTTTLGPQTLTWTPNGKLATAGTTTSPVSYVYDADGNQLIANNNGTTTLYLPGEQLTLSGTTTTGIRYYTFAGKVIAEGDGTTLYWLTGNTQGTMTTAVAAFSQSTVIRRATTPYGTVLNGSGTWPDNRTMLGDPYHTANGLIDIGARKYNPATGLFISVDPILDPASPQTMTGYTYAADDPASSSDPTGLVREPPLGGNSCSSTTPGCPGYTPPQPICYYCYNPNPNPGTGTGSSGAGGGTTGSTSPSSSGCPVVALTCVPNTISPTSQPTASAPRTCVQACIWATPFNNALVGSGATLSWFQVFSRGLHRIGRPAYLARNPWTNGAIGFGRSSTAKDLGRIHRWRHRGPYPRTRRDRAKRGRRGVYRRNRWRIFWQRARIAYRE
jgi:RHS repeat-associated protein